MNKKKFNYIDFIIVNFILSRKKLKNSKFKNNRKYRYYVTIVRAAAKNFKDVSIIADKKTMVILYELNKNKGTTSLNLEKWQVKLLD